MIKMWVAKLDVGADDSSYSNLAKLPIMINNAGSKNKCGRLTKKHEITIVTQSITSHLVSHHKTNHKAS